MTWAEICPFSRLNIGELPPIQNSVQSAIERQNLLVRNRDREIFADATQIDKFDGRSMTQCILIGEASRIDAVDRFRGAHPSSS